MMAAHCSTIHQQILNSLSRTTSWGKQQQRLNLEELWRKSLSVRCEQIRRSPLSRCYTPMLSVQNQSTLSCASSSFVLVKSGSREERQAEARKKSMLSFSRKYLRGDSSEMPEYSVQYRKRRRKGQALLLLSLRGERKLSSQSRHRVVWLSPLKTAKTTETGSEDVHLLPDI